MRGLEGDPGVGRCRYPGCTRSAVPAPPGGGRPPSYCSDPAHNRVRAFRARQRTAEVRPGPPHTLPSDVPVEPDPRGAPQTVPAEVHLTAETRRADRAEAVAEERREQLREAEQRAERRIADLLDRLLLAAGELAELRAEIVLLRRGVARPGRATSEQHRWEDAI